MPRTPSPEGNGTGAPNVTGPAGGRPLPGFPGGPHSFRGRPQPGAPQPDMSQPDTPQPGMPQGASGRPVPPRPGGPVPPRPRAPRPGGRGSRHRKPASRRGGLSRRQKMAAAMVLVVGLLTIGFATGFGSEASAEPTVQAFLLDWQQGRYAQAAALTNGSPAQVSAQLTAAYSDLDATNTFFAMGPVTQHGNTAVVSFKATVDLAEGEHQWSYTGRFTLTQKNGQWRV